MTTPPAGDHKPELEKLIKKTRNACLNKLIAALRDQNGGAANQLVRFAKQLEAARSSADLLRELFRTGVMEPSDSKDPIVMSLRKFLGWNDNATDFNGLRPEFLDVIYLLPPRDYAIVETLVPLLEHTPSESSVPQDGTQRRRLLDVGTGTGLLVYILRSCGVTGAIAGIDPAAKMVHYANQRLGQLGLGTVKLTTEKIEDFHRNEQTFQAVLSYMVMHHIIPADSKDKQYRNALKNVFDALEEGGLFVYTDKLWAEGNASGSFKPFDFRTAKIPVELDSGQELEIQPAELKAIQPFQPHPENVPEYPRTWKHAAESLSQAGFLIERAKPLNERVFLFVCRKPHVSTWITFAEKPLSKFADTLSLYSSNENIKSQQKHAPYQWTFDCLAALYEDVTGQLCPDTSLTADKEVDNGKFLRGIAYFSWEKASRLFLVRRARPFDFHILSYSHVHAGWGSLGRMVEEFEKGPATYGTEKGYTCLTRDAVQRTLPFLGDIHTLKYEAAMAVPVYRPGNHELRGAFLLYLAKREYVPLHTGSSLQKGLVEKFQQLNNAMNCALDLQEKKLGIQNSAQAICEEWDRLVQHDAGKDLVIAKLDITFQTTHVGSTDYQSLPELCSRIQALLSGSEYFSVLDEQKMTANDASILVAARYGISFDDMRGKILAVVGIAAEKCGPLSYTCSRLGEESPLKLAKR